MPARTASTSSVNYCAGVGLATISLCCMGSHVPPAINSRGLKRDSAASFSKSSFSFAVSLGGMTILIFTYSSPRPPPRLFESLTAQSQPLAALRARRNLHLHRSIESRNRDFRAQRRLPRRHRKLDLHVIVADNLEQPMRLDSHMQVEIARRCSVRAWFALPRQSNDGAVPHPGRNGYFKRFRAVNDARTAAGRTDLPVLGARALALRASFGDFQRDAALHAAMRLFERERDLGLDVLAGHPETCAARALPRRLPNRLSKKSLNPLAPCASAEKSPKSPVKSHAAVPAAGWRREIGARLSSSRPAGRSACACRRRTRTSYASLISLNFSSADLSPGFTSG